MEERNISVTKVFSFDSAHNLNNYDGVCKNLHGHTYKLEITITGTINEIGMVCDFNEISYLVKENIISKMDHKYLNEVFDFNPTCELMVQWIWKEFSNMIKTKEYTLKKITLWETPTSFATIE